MSHDADRLRAVRDDPLIVALFAKLPAPGAEWPRAERKKWLAAASALFDYLYRRPPGESPDLADRGRKGGAARAESLSPARRSEIARKAANVRHRG